MGEQGFLSISDLRKVPPARTRTKIVNMPEWGGRLKIRAFALGEHRDCRARARRDDGTVDERRLAQEVLQLAVVEPKLSEDDAEYLCCTLWGPVERLLTEIWGLSAMTPTGEISAKAVDEAEAQFRE